MQMHIAIVHSLKLRILVPSLIQIASNPRCDQVSVATQLGFQRTQNMTEYETYILGHLSDRIDEPYV